MDAQCSLTLRNDPDTGTHMKPGSVIEMHRRKDEARGLDPVRKCRDRTTKDDQETVENILLNPRWILMLEKIIRL